MRIEMIYDSGILTGVGVGPGDPELLTLKAARTIRESDVVSFPGNSPEESVAFRIAEAALPWLPEKELLPVGLPMTRDRRKLADIHSHAADVLEEKLKEGKNIAFLTLGDPSLYSTFVYIARLVRQDGFRTESVSGVPSFCEAAAKLGIPIASGEELVRILPILPAGEDLAENRKSQLDADSDPNSECLIFLKAGRHAGELRDRLKAAGYEVSMAENCSMADEVLYRDADEIPDRAGYFSLMIARKGGL